jgi:hypothetical protein
MHKSLGSSFSLPPLFFLSLSLSFPLASFSLLLPPVAYLSLASIPISTPAVSLSSIRHRAAAAGGAGSGGHGSGARAGPGAGAGRLAALARPTRAQARASPRQGGARARRAWVRYPSGGEQPGASSGARSGPGARVRQQVCATAAQERPAGGAGAKQPRRTGGAIAARTGARERASG